MGAAEAALLLRPANFFQRLLSQDFGIAFAAFRKLDNLSRDSSFDVVGAVASPRGRSIPWPDLGRAECPSRVGRH
jgi:hypothetical protein